MRPDTLGILAGSGELPRRLADISLARGRDIFIIAVSGETDPATVTGLPHAWVDIAAVGRTVKLLRNAGCHELCIAGGVSRPDFAALKPDWAGVKLLPKVLAAVRDGDDALLRVMVRYFEDEGFQVIGSDAVAADLIAPLGALGAHGPDAAAEADIAHGLRVVKALGSLDIGQAAVIRDGQVLAVEAAEGTDQMLLRCRAFRRAEQAGVLVKLMKPTQEKRVDLPTIGPVTIANAVEAGLSGLAVEAGATIVLEDAKVVSLADTNKLFVIGITAGACA